MCEGTVYISTGTQETPELMCYIKMEKKKISISIFFSQF